MPLAFAAAALVGLGLALSLTTGRPRTDAGPAPGHAHGAPPKSRFRQDNDLSWNPGAFVAAAGLIGALVLLAVLIEVL